jgi:hypothetical protein
MRGTEASMPAEIQISPELSIQVGSEEWRKMRSKHRLVSRLVSKQVLEIYSLQKLN